MVLKIWGTRGFKKVKYVYLRPLGGLSKISWEVVFENIFLLSSVG